ncbi:MAG: MFS transporter, partial [Methanosarcinales archaeon]
MRRGVGWYVMDRGRTRYPRSHGGVVYRHHHPCRVCSAHSSTSPVSCTRQRATCCLVPLLSTILPSRAAIGNGKFQYVAALICGLANAADAVELLCVSFILPELEGITDYEKGALSASVFVGMLVGGILAGVASDAWGRKPLLAACLLLNGVFGLLSVAAPTWPWLAACRVIAGVGVGGSIPGVFGLFSEFLPVAKRGFFISLVAWQWMVGTIYT